MNTYKVNESFAIILDKKYSFEIGQVIPDNFFARFPYPDREKNGLINSKKIELVKKEIKKEIKNNEKTITN